MSDLQLNKSNFPYVSVLVYQLKMPKMNLEIANFTLKVFKSTTSHTKHFQQTVQRLRCAKTWINNQCVDITD